MRGQRKEDRRGKKEREADEEGIPGRSRGVGRGGQESRGQGWAVETDLAHGVWGAWKACPGVYEEDYGDCGAL